VKTTLVSVVGGAECTSQEALWAEDTGRRLAQADVGVVCGDKGGVMEAACRGAWQAGGLTVGLLPGEEAGEGNDYLTRSCRQVWGKPERYSWCERARPSLPLEAAWVP